MFIYLFILFIYIYIYIFKNIHSRLPPSCNSQKIDVQRSEMQKEAPGDWCRQASVVPCLDQEFHQSIWFLLPPVCLGFHCQEVRR